VELLHRNRRLRPKLVITHINLGHCFTRVGRFAEALESYRQGLQVAVETGSRHRPLVEEQVREAERRVELDRRLSAGKPEPADGAEALAFAEVYNCKTRYADAVEVYLLAFTLDPKLAEDLNDENRFSAACVAALASAGRGLAAPPDAPGRTRLRQQALTWLREDLDVWSRLAGDPQKRPTAEATLRRWQRHPDLANLRDPATDKLPDDERQACQRFWQDVRAVLGMILGN
jgi:tetratricopeptide (TPR) repeat protein